MRALNYALVFGLQYRDSHFASDRQSADNFALRGCPHSALNVSEG
jgi:hypothetical protein